MIIIRVVLDSNFLFALTFKKDKNFKRAYEILSELREAEVNLITNNLVLEETFTLVVARFNGNSFYLEELSNLFWGDDKFFLIHYLTQEDYKSVFETLKKYVSSKRLLSFVDASLIYLYQKYNAEKIISFDGHFDNILPRWD